MATWSKDELCEIAKADDLHISPFREDGVTYGTPTWIWSVALTHMPLRAFAVFDQCHGRADVTSHAQGD